MTPAASILVAGAEGIGKDSTTRALASAGYAVRTASSAAHCLALATDRPPDLLLFAGSLAEGNVDELIGRLRATPELTDLFIVRADGSESSADGLLPRPCEERELLGLIAAFVRLQRAERSTSENEENLRAVFAASPAGLALYDSEFRYLLVNEAMAAFHDLPVEEHIGRTVFDVLPESGEMVAALFRQILATGEPVLDRELSGEIGARPGETSYFTVSYFPIPQQGDSQVAIGAAVIDITKLKRAEAEREKLQARLLQANKMESIGRLAGGVAHDFNNMLGVILGRTEIALEELDPAHPLKEDLEEIQSVAGRTADLTRQLLAFARKQTVEPEVLRLNELVDRSLGMMRRLIGENVELDWLPDADLWRVRIDPVQVEQILTNLCINARDSIAEVGKLVIDTRNRTLTEADCAGRPAAGAGDFVRLAVSDDGCGMSPETLEHLFEPFYTTKEGTASTGLGLATVYGIVQQNGGFIEISSQPGSGTTVEIHLPRSHEREAKSAATNAGEAATGGGETVLLVEDDPAILRLAGEMLTSLGYQVETAAAPADALRLAGEETVQIDLLMTDVIMPEMNGWDLAQQLRSQHPGLGCLLMSGYTADVIAQRGELPDGVHFLQKPFSKLTLAAKVREALEQTATAG